MADPLTLGLLAVSTLAGVRSAQAQSAAQQSQLQAQVEAERFNQQVAEQNKQVIRGQTQAEVEQADRERRLRVGANIAQAGGAGVGISAFEDILQDNAAQEELNILTIKSEGLLRETDVSRGQQVSSFREQSARAQQPIARQAGQIGVATSVLRGATRIAGGSFF